MSVGYTPLFSSLTTGTLCGRWPDIGLWPIVLSLADRCGVVDVTPGYLAKVTGLPVSDVITCMQRFCEPDPYSRTPDEGGARLLLLEPESRSWGWRVVNHAKYRERARKTAYDSARTESGRDAERKRQQRARDVPTSPDATAVSRDDPLSDADANTNKTLRVNPSAAPPPAKPVRAKVSRESLADWLLDFKVAYPERAGDQGWRKAQRAGNARLAEGHTPRELIDGARRYAEYCRATGKVGTEYVKQAATFLGPDKSFLDPWTPPATKADNRLAANLAAADQFMRRTEAS